MRKELFEEEIIENQNGTVTSYVLNQSDMFYDIGYRVMKNQEKGSILPCHKLKYNGKIKLVYFTEELVSLQKLFMNLDVMYAGTVIANLVTALEEVQSNGFLAIECIDNRLDKIFVARNNFTIKLIYLPLNMSFGGEKSAIYSEMRAQLVKLLQETQPMENAIVKDIVGVLTDGTVSLSEIPGRIHGSSISSRKGDMKIDAAVISDTVSKTDSIVLKAVDGSVTIHVSKEIFVIGKSQEKADYVIEGNPAVSRVHCRILRKDNRVYIADLKSANGTFVNQQRILPEQSVEINDGTRIRIANMEFILRR